MKRLLDLAELEEDAIAELLALARELHAAGPCDRLAGKVLGLLFMNPSVRTLASFQSAMARLGGSSFVVTPGQGSWKMETRPGVVMDGEAAEHIREAIPVLEEYADALGVRCFGAGRDVAEELEDPVMAGIAEIAKKPLINLESAASHPCQSLADWKTLDDCKIPGRGGRFVLSWASHPRPLPIAVPVSTVLMAARRGMEVTVLRPEGFSLPDSVMDQAAMLASSSGGSVRETSDRNAAMDGAAVLYAKSWRAPAAFGEPAKEAELRAAAGAWTVEETWFGPSRRDAIFMHCLPVRRNVVVRDEILDGPRSRVIQQAGNRRSAQAAILLKMLGDES